MKSALEPIVRSHSARLAMQPAQQFNVPCVTNWRHRRDLPAGDV